MAAALLVSFGALAAPPDQANTPSPSSQRVDLLGQTGGLVTDFAIGEHDNLLFASEGEALTILRLQEDGQPAALLSRISPNRGRIQGIAVVGDVAYLITPIGPGCDRRSGRHEPNSAEFLAWRR